MSTIRLYFDADAMERALVLALRARGVDVTTAGDAKTTHISDEDQLAFAQSELRTLVTFNASDFCRIHGDILAQGRSHAGIILVPQQRYSIGERMRRLLALLAARSAEDMRNRLEFLSNWP